jgi:hypothetical protein
MVLPSMLHMVKHAGQNHAILEVASLNSRQPRSGARELMQQMPCPTCMTCSVQGVAAAAHGCTGVRPPEHYQEHQCAGDITGPAGVQKLVSNACFCNFFNFCIFYAQLPAWRCTHTIPIANASKSFLFHLPLHLHWQRSTTKEHCTYKQAQLCLITCLSTML